ncbi:NACHT, LRR and PYD domains-containing protein 12-like [Mixophyes fleayi]|uniref:NACHT, LRR and PYD domains-containing protein 12-like n=1 Tax=Mixophyes fleayi TaxID=3061075 RepID=UPI003F4E02E6
MARPKSRSQDHGGIQEFHQQLAEYKMYELRLIYKYFRDDLICIVESLSTQRLLTELRSRTRLKAENYATMKEDLGVTKYSKRLVQDIFEEGREAVIGFWQSLYALHKDHPHPNLTGILKELIHTGHTLVQQILLDKYGHQLSPELKESQKEHKQHLLKKTQNLVENKPPGSTQEVQHFYISERFVKLIVVSTDHFRQRSQNELVETGEKHERYLKKPRDELKHLYFNRLFHWCHEAQCVPCSVMVSGVPGIGKTTLMQKFVYDWVTGKLYQRFAFVFFFKFRELNRLDKVSLETMILQQYPYLQRQLGNILGDPAKLLFIFDGLDESTRQMDFSSNKVCSNSKQVEDPIMIVGCLLKQSLLKGCSVLMTSRPTNLATINTDVFQRITEIMGFFLWERQTYFENFFKNKIISEKAFHYVQENETLYTFCYIPSYCWIICTVLASYYKVQPTNTDQLVLILPKTVTQLFVTFIANILSNHSLDKNGARELMTSIGWMAEHGVMNHFIVFDERDLGSFKVDSASQLLSSFMMESDQPPNVTFTFLHLTLQEFFAALVHYLDYCPEKLQKSLAKSQSFKDCRGEVFVRFLCGLSDVSTKAVLKPYLGQFSSQSSEQVIKWLQSRLPELDHLNSNTWDKRKALNLLTYFFESKNKALGLEIPGSKRKLDFTGFHLSPLDCTVLSFILESCRKTEELNLSRCLIANEGLERLAPNLHTVVDLRLCNNDLTDSSCPLLASAVKSNKFLRTLDLSGNQLEGPHFCDLVTTLSSPTCRIEELKLCNAGLTDKSTSSLSLLISENNFLKKLDLSDNKVEGPHFSELMRALSSTDCSIEDMHVKCNILQEMDVYHLATNIRHNQSLRKLDLSGNKLVGSYFNDLITALSCPTCKIEELMIYFNTFSEKERKSLKDLEGRRPGLKIFV